MVRGDDSTAVDVSAAVVSSTCGTSAASFALNTLREVAGQNNEKELRKNEKTNEKTNEKE